MILARQRTAPMETSLTESLQGGRLLLIRHGQTAWNAERRFLGRTDLALDDVGRAQAARLGARLAGQVDRVWSSPLLRARETAGVVGVPSIDDDLTEMDMGELEGLLGHEVEARFPGLMTAWRDHPEAIVTPGGETLAAVEARGLAAITRIAATVRPGERVAVVTHQLLLATAICRLQGVSRAEYRRFMHRNTGITTLDAATLRPMTVDDAGHLEG